MVTAFKALENRVEALETLTAPLTTEDAKRLHQSLAGTSKTIEMAADMLDGQIEMPDSEKFQFPTKKSLT